MGEPAKTDISHVPLVEAQFFTQSTGKLLRPLDTETKQKYKESAVRRQRNTRNTFADWNRNKYSL